MKFLKLQLADKKIYTFSTFTLCERISLREKFREFQKMELEGQKLMFEYDNEKQEFKKDSDGNMISIKMTDEHDKKVMEHEQKASEFMINIVRKSMCRNHPEFVIQTDKTKEKDIMNKLFDLFDMDDLKDITYFAFSGTYTKQEMIIDATYTDAESTTDKK